MEDKYKIVLLNGKEKVYRRDYIENYTENEKEKSVSIDDTVYLGR